MLGWIFKKKGIETGSAPTMVTTSQVANGSATDVDWTAALALARGDNDALLALARSAATPIQAKQAAVEALTGEAALRLAEREFRSHDRRVHQLAKQRLQTTVAQRKTREHAARLLESTRGLMAMTEVPVNRLVELDRAWQALDAEAVEPAQRDDFTALMARLAAQLRERADIELQRRRWQADAVAAQRQLQAACAETAAGTQNRERLAVATHAARGVEGALRPHGEADPATVRALDELQHAIRIAIELDVHLAVLDRLVAGSAQTVPRTAEDARAVTGPGDDSKAECADGARDDADADRAITPSSMGDAQREWQALPPLSDPHLAALLQTRHARWQQACDQVREAKRSQRREQERERQRGRQGQQALALADGVAQAETALDAGQLADAHRLLMGIDEQLQGADAPVALQTRIATAQARLAQLRGWQHWAGGRARDELVQQAEALAAATVGVDGKVDGNAAADGAVVAEVARLSIRQRAEVIKTLRQRWKEIDGLSGPGTGGRALWQRFDAALQAAGEPVAAHVAAQRAAREANLSARQQLLEILEAVGETTASEPAASPDEVNPPDDAAQPQTPAEPPAPGLDHPRRLATALDRFHAEWRKLGPLEHTVPRQARGALLERMEAAVRRVEAPLEAARAAAGAQRQGLVARARALAGDAPGRGRDLVGEVRALQAEWQRHAKALPLARAHEQALWSDFKAAIDAAFAAREAAYSAREAEFEAHAAERTALIERLRPRPGDSPATQRRTLAEVDAAWQRCGPAPRDRADALEAQFRAAREGLRQCSAEGEQRAWQAICDALDAKLALCKVREQMIAEGAALDAAATAASWSTLPALPAPLEDAIRRRAGLAQADGTDAAPDVDDLLLQIETAWDLPTPPAFESARRERKLLALKDSLEGRRLVAPKALAPVAAMARLLSRADLDAGQHGRLAAMLAEWRRRGPQRPS